MQQQFISPKSLVLDQADRYIDIDLDDCRNSSFTSSSTPSSTTSSTLTPQDMVKLSGLATSIQSAQETSTSQLSPPELLASPDDLSSYDSPFALGFDPLFAHPSPSTATPAATPQDVSLNWESLFSNSSPIDIFGSLDAGIDMLAPSTFEQHKPVMPDLPSSAAPNASSTVSDPPPTTTTTTTAATTPVMAPTLEASSRSTSLDTSRSSSCSPLTPKAEDSYLMPPAARALAPAAPPNATVTAPPTPTPASSNQVGRKRGCVSQLSPLEYDENDATARKRAKNTMAARKSRARRFEQAERSCKRIKELEQEVEYWKGVAHNRLGLV